MVDFKFNGTESFNNFLDKLGLLEIVGTIEPRNKKYLIVEQPGSLKINVAGFEKDEIKVKFNKATKKLSVICKGNSPFFGTDYKFTTDVDTDDAPFIEYRDGVLGVYWKISKNELEEIDLCFERGLFDRCKS